MATVGLTSDLKSCIRRSLDTKIGYGIAKLHQCRVVALKKYPMMAELICDKYLCPPEIYTTLDSVFNNPNVEQNVKKLWELTRITAIPIRIKGIPGADGQHEIPVLPRRHISDAFYRNEVTLDILWFRENGYVDVADELENIGKEYLELKLMETTIKDTFQKVFETVPNLNQALIVCPAIREYVPSEYIERVNKKVERKTLKKAREQVVVSDEAISAFTAVKLTL
jgi:hypothetical protein